MSEQIDLFSYSMPKYHITKPIRLIELFAGIGSQYAALKNIGADVAAWKVVEWDKYAILSYNAVHGTNFETSDVTKIHAKDLEIVEREIPIKNKTKTGYLFAENGDSIDISPRMIYHRGTVQKGIAHTIKTSCDVGVLIIEHKTN